MNISERRIQEMKNTTNQLIESDKFQAVFSRLVNFNLKITEDQADKLLEKINHYTINFEWKTLSGKEDQQELTVDSSTKPFLKEFLTGGLSMINYSDWGSDDIDRIPTQIVYRITLTPPTVKSVEPIEVKKSTPPVKSVELIKVKKSRKWVRNPNTGRLIKVDGPTYKKLYPNTNKSIEMIKPVPAPRSVKQVVKPVPAPRSVKPKIIIVDDTKNVNYLKKLSKKELIKMLLKKDSKPVQKKDNLEDLMDDEPVPFEQEMRKVKRDGRKIDTVDDKIKGKYMLRSRVQTKSKIITYPKTTVSLSEFRRDEVRTSKNSKKGSSFLNLFEQRLKKIEGDRRLVSIILDVQIATSDCYRKYKKNTNKKDEYNIEKKKVMKQSGGEFVVRKTYGPFSVEIPKHLTKRDTYKFMMYTLLKQKFTILSGESIEKLGGRIVPYNKKQFLSQSMGKLKLESYLLNKQRPIKSHGVNTCVVDYVWDQVKGKRGFKTYNYDKLKNEIYEFAPEGEMISTEELIDWAKTCHERVSIHAYDARYRKFIKHTKGHPDVVLVYIVKDNHCYPITDQKLKLVASKANQGGCDDLLKHMSDL